MQTIRVRTLPGPLSSRRRHVNGRTANASRTYDYTPPPLRTHHVEGALGEVVVRPRQDLLETLNGVLQGHEHPLGAGEHLRHREGLRHEPLHLAGPRHSQLVVFRELVHSQDGDDVLRVWGGGGGCLILSFVQSGDKQRGWGVCEAIVGLRVM